MSISEGVAQYSCGKKDDFLDENEGQRRLLLEATLQVFPKHVVSVFHCCSASRLCWSKYAGV